MSLKITNNKALPGMRGGSPAGVLPSNVKVAAGYELWPGFAAYWADNSGLLVRPPLNNRTVITFSAAPTSGDNLSVTVEGTTYTQAFDTNANTTMEALATKLEADANVDSATVGGSDTTLTLLATSGNSCTVTAASNDDGATTTAISAETTDTFAFLVTRQDDQPIYDTTLAQWVHKYPEKYSVTGVTDGDSVSCPVGGESGTYNISTAARVRVVADSGTNQRPGQIMFSDTGNTVSVAETQLSFMGEGSDGDTEFIQVTKGA